VKTSSEQRIKRHTRIRKKIKGTAERPRLAVFRSNRHLYAQLIDDVAGRTLASASTVDPSLRSESTANSVESAAKVGSLVAERAAALDITSVVFDRGGFRFHGKVKALADGAREKGLQF
jgi:large subunit ribosomal protein L18